MWYYTPGVENVTGAPLSGGTWTQVIPSTGVLPPPLIRLQSAWDSFTDSLYVWWGERQRSNFNIDPSAMLWQFSWYVLECASVM